MEMPMPKVFAYRSVLALAAVAAAALVCGAQPKASQPALPPTVEATMEQVDDTVGDLQKDLARPDGMADALKRIWEIERLALHAKTMTPEHLKGGPTPETLLGYHKAQVELMTMLLKVESAILNND